ncbi:MAG: bifunctional phosphoribosylaminoimidazolecarboxamide formyltransferase/IMP cyclohydrolase, partial [Gemmatimonadetes bacterium]|nr:bifunctional phosphoribosylaminoimidazolecarboxamide formyltransferase/IMP cyclohydrolase [Gemmatimonadota bacterium]
TLAARQALAAEAFVHTATYDVHVASWMGNVLTDTSEGSGFPAWVGATWDKAASLRYGENPHQRAAIYTPAGPHIRGLAQAEQVQGKELSYNNYNDADAALELCAEFAGQDPAVIIVKHANPCGVAQAATLLDAWTAALQCDHVSAFGGIVALNRPLDGPTAQAICEIFTEVVVAPGADEAARAAFAAKKNLRLLEGPVPSLDADAYELRRVGGGFLVQGPNLRWLPEGDPRESLDVPTAAAPSEAQWADLLFAWTVCRSVASNAIVLAKEGATIGVGGGQTNRVGAVDLAVRYARELGHETGGCVLASDGFFPFADNVEAAAEAGVAAIIQPGGSRRDAEVIEAADRSGIPMVLTGNRQFRH